MATLIFSALGTLVGGPLGGVLGALAGQQVDAAIFGGEVQGPRLSDLSVTASSYGSAIPRHFGRMRVPGSIIWATDLVEHSQTSGGGKGSPSITTYSYTTSFAVALASRPLLSVGRIWADGKLLRGSAGDLKVGGTMRFHPGDFNQTPDALIASAEGTSLCPAFRGTAYVVFEDLDLSTFGNRIPTLSFEVIADSGALSLAQLFDGTLDDVSAAVPLTGTAGFSCESSFGETLSKFQSVYPVTCSADADSLVIGAEFAQAAPVPLDEAAVSNEQGDFGPKTGFSRKREPPAANPTLVLRYYDVDLDYQPGSQRNLGQPGAGQPKTLQLPAAMAASDAQRLVNQAARRNGWARETLAWRTTELDPAVAPGTIVTVPGYAGTWRVTDWEWRAGGVELSLERLAPAIAQNGFDPSAGRANLAVDVVTPSTSLVAYEMPADASQPTVAPAFRAALSAANAHWAGAALYVDQGDGALSSLGVSTRTRGIIGTATSVLAPASPLIIDRASTVTIQLTGADQALVGATIAQLMLGANQALIGDEIVQFGRATSLGSGLWQIGQLLRGRAGTEAAISGHRIGECFAVLDRSAIALDPGLVGANPVASIAALGLGDATSVESPIVNRGIGQRPLFPVHAAATIGSDGSLTLTWTRRARGAWLWSDGVDAPLVEEAEAYLVTYGPVDARVAQWRTGTNQLVLGPDVLAGLVAQLARGDFSVRQQGTYALSLPTLITQLP